MDRGAWHAIVHGVAKSWIQLTFSLHIHVYIYDSYKYLTSPLKTVKIIKNRESLRHCYSQEGPKAT